MIVQRKLETFDLESWELNLSKFENLPTLIGTMVYIIFKYYKYLVFRLIQGLK
jgi:hypothetical protein